jgi:hypothetical protein
LKKGKKILFAGLISLMMAAALVFIGCRQPASDRLISDDDLTPIEKFMVSLGGQATVDGNIVTLTTDVTPRSTFVSDDEIVIPDGVTLVIPSAKTFTLTQMSLTLAGDAKLVIEPNGMIVIANGQYIQVDTDAGIIGDRPSASPVVGNTHLIALRTSNYSFSGVASITTSPSPLYARYDIDVVAMGAGTSGIIVLGNTKYETAGGNTMSSSLAGTLASGRLFPAADVTVTITGM